MGSWRYNIRPAHAHSNVHTVKTAREVRGIYRGQREPFGYPLGSGPLDRLVFTAGFTILSRPGFLYINLRPQKSPVSAGLIRHAKTADKPLRRFGSSWPEAHSRPRCRSPPSPFRFAHPKIGMEEKIMTRINLTSPYTALKKPTGWMVWSSFGLIFLSVLSLVVMARPIA